MEIQRIDLEARGVKPRNVHRVVAELDIASQNGKVVEGVRLKHGINQLEVYADRVQGIVDNSRGPQHEAALEQATRMCEVFLEGWEKDNASARRGKTDAEWDEFRKLRCNHRPEQFVALTGLAKTLPSILSVKVLSRDQSKKVDARTFLQMEDDARGEFLIDPPPTHESARDEQRDLLAAIAAGLGGGRSNRKG